MAHTSGSQQLLQVSLTVSLAMPCIPLSMLLRVVLVSQSWHLVITATTTSVTAVLVLCSSCVSSLLVMAWSVI